VTLPSGADQGFTDLTGIQADAVTAINQLKQLGITTGTTATTFNPNGVVNRWQMALFLSRLVTAAGVTLPATPVGGGFTDLTGVQADAAKAINQLFDVGITTGTTATTFNPNGNVNRWQMALFLARTAAADNVAPTGLGSFVWDYNLGTDTYKYADADACASTTVTYKSTDKFFVNGVPATLAAFEAALGAITFTGTNNGKVSPSTGVHNLTTGVKVTSGVLAGVAPLAINEPVSDNTLATFVPVANEFYSVDGVATTLAGFNAAASVGDTLVVTGGDGSTAAKARTLTLTNGSVSGSIYAVAPYSIETACQVFAVGAPLVTDAITIDGTADTQANFLIEASEGDSLVYSYSAGKGTWALTNAAPTIQTGEAAANIVGTTFDIYKSSTVTEAGVDWAAAWDILMVNGSAATPADFAAKLTPGDAISWRIADTQTSTKSMLALTDAAYSGVPAVLNVGTTLSVYSFGTSGSTLDLVDYAVVDADLGLTLGTGGAVKWQVNGATATPAQFEAGVAFAIANKTGNVSVAKVGVDIVWSATTS
jgi:hypothetical protein